MWYCQVNVDAFQACCVLLDICICILTQCIYVATFVDVVVVFVHKMTRSKGILVWNEYRTCLD